MAERGYYSLIQFVPNPGRAEGANVGVVLVCPALGTVNVRMSENNEPPKRLFRAGSFDDSRLAIAKESMAARLVHDLNESPTLEGLRRVRALEANSLTLTEPRAVAVTNSPAELVEELRHELVFVEPRKRERAHAPDTSALVKYLEEHRVPIDKPGQVKVPVTNEPLKVAFSYYNGAHHFVYPQGFSKKGAIDQAKGVGAQGRLLHVHSDNPSCPNKLVVFAEIADQNQAKTLSDLLQDMDVRLVDARDADDFAREIEATAHPPTT